MVTNYPQQLAAAAEVTPKDTPEIGLVARLATRFGQVLCALHGHDSVLHFERNRVLMRCTSCGHDTPGWEISGEGPRKRFDGDKHRHLLNKPRLVLRKTA